MADGFLGRWSQRKQDIRAGKPLAEPEVAEKVVAKTQSSANLSDTPKNFDKSSDIASIEEKPETPSPTMADVHKLTAESDFSPFVAKNVSSDVRNSAMKKLFTDPHYNVMDRLDIYIDDYSQPDPIPMAMMRQLASAKFLNLFKAEEEAEAAAEKAALEAKSLGDDANTVSVQSVAQSNTEKLTMLTIADTATISTTLKTPISGINDDHSDLRLQQNHAAGLHKLGRSAE